MKETVTITISMAEQRNEQIRDTFQKEKKGLLEFIRRRVPSRADAEDILQDVFFQFSKNFSIAEPIERVSAWLYQVARNRIIDSYRKKKPDPVGEINQDPEDAESPFLLKLFDPLNNPEDEMIRSLVWKGIEEALAELPAEQREAFILHEIEGKYFKEIAEIKNVSVNTLLSRKRYAVLHLRKKLKVMYDELLNN
jgi:RNA polymerase sigma factor (sigma-70 family)